jgi:hypothetical protein
VRRGSSCKLRKRRYGYNGQIGLLDFWSKALVTNLFKFQNIESKNGRVPLQDEYPYTEITKKADWELFSGLPKQRETTITDTPDLELLATTFTDLLATQSKIVSLGPGNLYAPNRGRRRNSETLGKG